MDRNGRWNGGISGYAAAKARWDLSVVRDGTIVGKQGLPVADVQKANA